VHARRAELVEAEQMARQAVDYAERTDLLAASGLAHLDLAEVLEAAGRTDQAAVEVETALGLFEQKGDLPMAEQARARLQRLL
jgi:hypothetical protein